MNLKNLDFAKSNNIRGQKKIPIGRFIIGALLVFFIYRCWNPEATSATTPKNKKEDSVVLSKKDSLKAEKFKIDSLKKEELKKDSLESKTQVIETPLSKWAAKQPDSTLAEKIGTYLERYHPKAAVYLMVDGKSNQPLAWGQWSDSTLQENAEFITQATFPAASLIKTLSAAAALESGQYSNHTPIPQMGSYHTLYKKQLEIPRKYSGETLTLESAYAKSANPPFGIIGQKLGSDYMVKISEKLGFNKEFPQNKPQKSTFNPSSDLYALAEAACGFTKENTLSPLLAAAISRSILTGKELEIPYHKNNYNEFPEKAFKIDDSKLDKNTYFGLKKMMETTSLNGTSSRLLRKNLFRYVRQDLVVGSKTGTLDGDEPEGRYDWFMGWAYDKANPDNSVIIILMQIQDDKRTLGTSAIAALLLNDWHKFNLSKN